MKKKIQTVTGPAAPEEMGVTLPHEHIMVDFIGAGETGRHRYESRNVVRIMLPHLQALVHQGVKTFVDATPMYLGRDPELLRNLSLQSGLFIVTNTGQYKPPFLPSESFSLDAEKIAEKWIAEGIDGIDGTGILPGFVKTAVTPGPLDSLEEKMMDAAALTSGPTHLPIATHSGSGTAALEILDVLERREVPPEKWIFVHAQNEENLDLLKAVAGRGAWIELDAIGEGKEEKHLTPLLDLLEGGFEHRLLLSQDAGWYNVGEESGGVQKPFTFLIDRFLPLMRERGISEETIVRLTVRNPAEAFAV